MYRVKLLYDAQGWAHWRRCRVLADYAPEDFHVDIGCGVHNYSTHHYDLYLQLCCAHVGALRKHLDRMHHDSIMVSGLNVGYNERNAAWLQRNLEQSNHVIINSGACWEACGKPDRTTQISNGVDLRQWRVVTPIEARKPKVLFLGSRFHSEKGYRDTKSYWSILKPLMAELDDRGIDHDFRRVNSMGMLKMSGDKVVMRGADYMIDSELLDWYNTGTIYVVASEMEGTPNPPLEAAACGSTVVATRVGNMPELISPGINGELVDRTVESVLAGVLRAIENRYLYAATMQETIRDWDWSIRAAQYYALFRDMLAGVAGS